MAEAISSCGMTTQGSSSRNRGCDPSRFVADFVCESAAPVIHLRTSDALGQFANTLHQEASAMDSCRRTRLVALILTSAVTATICAFGRPQGQEGKQLTYPHVNLATN